MSDFSNPRGISDAIRLAQRELAPVSIEDEVIQQLDDMAWDVADARPELAKKIRKWKRSVERENPAARHTRRRLARGCIKLEG